MVFSSAPSHFSQEGNTRILTLDPVTIEFNGLTVKLQTKEYFEEGSSKIKIERNILEMSDPDAEVTIDEYMVACYGTTEYPSASVEEAVRETLVSIGGTTALTAVAPARTSLRHLYA